jgi:hypothetical protein
MPKFGGDQGATDSKATWGFICNLLIRLYKELATNALLKSALSDTENDWEIVALVDDTALLTTQLLQSPIIVLLLHINAQFWKIFFTLLVANWKY